MLRIETLRTIDRLRLSGRIADAERADLMEDVQQVIDTLCVVLLTDSILQRAVEFFPTAVGTLNALRLSTALAVREMEPLDLLLTHDQQLGIAARSLGYSVVGT